jgi:hypothetical protein
MDDNIWEYPFGDIDDDDDGLFRSPETESPGAFPFMKPVTSSYPRSFCHTCTPFFIPAKLVP